MTYTKSLPAADAVDPPEQRTKSVLFCPDCGHESPLNGDWICEGKGSQCTCPECQTVIGTRRSLT